MGPIGPISPIRLITPHHSAPITCFNPLYKAPCDLEATVSDTLPEVVVLAGFMVFERHITDDTEGDERCLIDMADLRNGTTLHVDRRCLREMRHYLTHLLT